jgi:glutamate/tyrosine decarboxylase-like PLP-dependent enzyme
MSDRAATLDLPDDELRALFEGALALAQREIEAAQTGPIYSEPPSAERFEQLLDGSRDLPESGESVGELLDACGALLEAGRRTSPAFFGYVLSPASPVGIAADLLASAANQNVTAWRSSPAATEVERLVLRWLGELVGFAPDAAGVLVSGGSHANLTALLVAMHASAREDADRRTLTAHISSEAHFSSAKAASIIGVTARAAAVDADRRIDVERLRAAIAQDRANGLEPFCIVASAGTTGTGAIDPLDELATLAADEGLWLHVDGAYGAFAAADAELRALFAGMERADSLALDAHKWLAVPLDCGALLLRDPTAAAGAFGSTAGDYVRVMADDDREAFAWWGHGIELSRRWRALKVWMTLRYYGARRIAAAVAEDVALAAYMAELVEAADDLELLSGPQLSICCLRHLVPGATEAELDAHNERLLVAVQRDGRAYLSNLTVEGHFAMRACITNFRTTRADIERTLAVVRELAAAHERP